jgi:hypothetical protein
MTDVNIDTTGKQTTYNVVEEEYTVYNETLLIQWLQIARTKSTAHNVGGKYFKFLHEFVGLPATILPIIYSPLSGVLADREGIQYANISILMITGLLSGIHTFFDFVRKSEKHFQYEGKYADLATTIMVELAKKREFRIRADRFVEMIQGQIDSFKSNEPLL